MRLLLLATVWLGCVPLLAGAEKLPPRVKPAEFAILA